MNLKYRFLYKNNPQDKHNMIVVQAQSNAEAFTQLRTICERKKLDPNDFTGYLGDNLQYVVK